MGDEDIAATVAAEQEERDATDAALSEAEEATNQGDEFVLASEDFQDKPFLSQAARLAQVATFAEGEWQYVETLIERGVPEDAEPVEATIYARDIQAISLGLNLVGFFVPEMEKHAKALMVRLEKLIESRPEDPAVRAKVDEITAALREEQIAAFFGVTVEEFRKIKEQEEAAALESGLPTTDEGGVVLN